MKRKTKKKKPSPLVAALNSYLDAGCIVAGASGLSLWANEFGLSSFQVGLLGAISANAFGAAIGALIGGPIVDKKGRRFVLQYSQLIYMLGALLVVFAMNFPMLLAGFATLGIGVGIGIPSSWTYLSEMAEPNKRAYSIGMSQVAWSAGPAVIFTLGVLFAPLGLLGNRLLFAILFIGSLIVFILSGRLDESVAMETIEKEEVVKKKPENPVYSLISLPINRRAIAFLVGIYLFWNIVASSMGMFMPYVYETIGGLSNLQANVLQAILWTIIVCSFYFIFAKFGDKVNRKKFYGFGAVIGIAAWVILTFVGMSWIGLASFVLLWGIHEGIGAQGFYALWATELFAPKYRGIAQGFMFFLVRGFTGIWSIVFPIVLDDLGFTTAGTLMIGSLVIALVIGVLWAPETRGKSLEQITQERYGDQFGTSEG